jgi:type IX secretion system PorP/SprF family membrane protein
MKRLTIIPLATLMFTSQGVNAQDIHFNDVTSMAVWYNQALKTDRKVDLRLAYRDVRYENLLAFQSMAAMLNLPLMNKQRREKKNDNGYLSVSIAGAYDQSSDGIYKNNIALAGMSYAQRLSAKEIYLAAGFQGSLTQNTFSYSGTSFPDQYSPNGPTANPTNDPINITRINSWYSINAGLSLFKNTEERDWYIGLSLRHANRPFTDEAKTVDFRMPRNWSLQSGITFKSKRDQILLQTLVHLKARAYEYLLGARYTLNLNPLGFNGDIGLGLSCRLQDAIIPNLRFRVGSSVFSFFYDKNISGIDAAGYTRRGFELSLVQQF